MEDIYREMKKMAASYMRREKSGHTLQPSALVNEAFIRLLDLRSISWKDRAHFLAMAATMMRRILVDNSRKKNAVKRGEGAQKECLDEELHAAQSSGPSQENLLALDAALSELRTHNERRARIVELRYFGGMSLEETAHVLGCSTGTVKREWAKAKVWLYTKLHSNHRSKRAA